jgi:hypothetical protein
MKEIQKNRACSLEDGKRYVRDDLKELWAFWLHRYDNGPFSKNLDPEQEY